jgi:hypothetical protein
MRTLFFCFITFIFNTCLSQQSSVISFGKTDQSVYGRDGLIDNNGNYIFGYTTDDHTELAFIDSNFNTVWVKDIGNAGSRHLAQITTGKYVYIGNKSIFSFNDAGNILWVKVLPEYSLFNEVLVLDSMHIIISFRESVHTGIMCLDLEGNIIWMKQVLNPNIYDVWIFDIFKLNNENFGFITELKESSNTTKYLLAKVTPSGIIVDQFYYESLEHQLDIYTGYQASNDDLYLVGNALSNDSTTTELKDIVILKLDNNGSFLAGKRYGYTFDDDGYDIKESKNHDFFVFANSKPKLICGGNLSIFRINSNLDTLWSKYYGTLDPNGANYRHLRVHNNLFYSYGYGTLWTTINSYCDAHVIKSDENFEYDCFKYDQILNVNTFSDFLLTNSNVIYQNYSIEFSTTFTDNPSYIQSADGCSGDILSAQNFNLEKTKIYPNPASQSVIIESDSKKIGRQIVVTDISGQIMGIYQFDNSTVLTVDIKNYSKGLYFVKIDEETQSLKLIVQ